MRISALLCAFALAAGCGGEPQSRVRGVDGGEMLRHHGISIVVPKAWEGRILYTDAGGFGAVIFQVANFTLSANEGFEPPEGLPPGDEDPIKAMAGDDLLIMVSTDQETAPSRALPMQITADSFLPSGAPTIPRGHAVAEEAGCIEQRCLKVTVDFAARPSATQLQRANEVLASLRVG